MALVFQTWTSTLVTFTKIRHEVGQVLTNDRRVLRWSYPHLEQDKIPRTLLLGFPSSNPLAKKEITIWLNGGPGCSSLDGLFQENGPVLWQYGVLKPTPIPWSWTNLTNMVWVEQ